MIFWDPASSSWSSAVCCWARLGCRSSGFCRRRCGRLHAPMGCTWPGDTSLRPTAAWISPSLLSWVLKAMLWFFASKMTAHAADVPEGRYVAVCVWALLRAVQIFDGSSLILHEHDAREASRMILLHLRTWQVLAARLEHLRVFYIRPKHHYMHHVAEDLLRTRLNPRSYQCFDDEAFLSRVKSISTKCHALTMTQRCLERYLLHLSFRVEQV